MRRRSAFMFAVLMVTATASPCRPAIAHSARPDDTTRPDTSRRRVVRGESRSRRASHEPPTRRGRLDDATPVEVAAAFRDIRSRDLIGRARRARFRQDSTLTSYDATVKQRLSAGLNVK